MLYIVCGHFRLFLRASVTCLNNVCKLQAMNDDGSGNLGIKWRQTQNWRSLPQPLGEHSRFRLKEQPLTERNSRAGTNSIVNGVLPLVRHSGRSFKLFDMIECRTFPPSSGRTVTKPAGDDALPGIRSVSVSPSQLRATIPKPPTFPEMIDLTKSSLISCPFFIQNNERCCNRAETRIKSIKGTHETIKTKP